MRRYNFLVAGHLFSIELDETVENIPLPRSFEKFRVEEIDPAAPKLFTLRVYCGFDKLLHYDRSEVTGFDWDGERCTIHKAKDFYAIEIADSKSEELRATMVATEDFYETDIFLREKGAWNSYIVNNFIMMNYAFASSYYNTLMIHASVILNNEKSYLFLGKSGTGKSTHSQLWLDNIDGSELLNDDNPIVRIFPDDKVIVYGSPWSGKTPCYKNISSEAGAFVMLEQAPENEIVRESYSKAFVSILTSCSVFRYHEDQYRNLCNTSIRLVELISGYKLKCKPDREAALLCHSTISVKA